MNTCRICGKEIGKTYSDKKLRCSSCRKSVENAIGYNERTVEYVEDELFAWKSEYKKLKKENKKLKSDLAFERTMLDNVRAEYKSLQNVIKRLKEELNHYKNTEAIQNSNRKSMYTPEEQELLDLDYGTGFTAKFVRH